ncbi:MAG: hypothetical protein AAF378_16575 [Cyanobacteria bacterium P01_A01_bin.84]
MKIIADFFQITSIVTLLSFTLTPVYARRPFPKTGVLKPSLTSIPLELSSKTGSETKHHSLLKTTPRNIEQYSITNDSNFVQNLQKYRQSLLERGINKEFSVPTPYGSRGYSILPENTGGQIQQLEENVLILKLGEEPVNQPSFQQGDGLILFNIDDE